MTISKLSLLATVTFIVSSFAGMSSLAANGDKSLNLVDRKVTSHAFDSLQQDDAKLIKSESSQKFRVKKGQEAFQPGEKVRLYKTDCYIASVRHGTKYRCNKTKVAEALVIRELTNGDWIVQAPTGAMISEGTQIEKDSASSLPTQN